MSGYDAALNLLAYRRRALALAESAHIEQRTDETRAELVYARRLYAMGEVRTYRTRPR